MSRIPWYGWVLGAGVIGAGIWAWMKASTAASAADKAASNAAADVAAEQSEQARAGVASQVVDWLKGALAAVAL